MIINKQIAGEDKHHKSGRVDFCISDPWYYRIHKGINTYVGVIRTSTGSAGARANGNHRKMVTLAFTRWQ